MQLPLPAYFPDLGPFSVNPDDGCAIVKIPVDQQFVKYSVRPRSADILFQTFLFCFIETKWAPVTEA